MVTGVPPVLTSIRSSSSFYFMSTPGGRPLSMVANLPRTAQKLIPFYACKFPKFHLPIQSSAVPGYVTRLLVSIRDPSLYLTIGYQSALRDLHFLFFKPNVKFGLNLNIHGDISARTKDTVHWYLSTFAAMWRGVAELKGGRPIHSWAPHNTAHEDTKHERRNTQQYLS